MDSSRLVELRPRELFILIYFFRSHHQIGVDRISGEMA